MHTVLLPVLLAQSNPYAIPEMMARWDASDASTLWADALGTPATDGGAVRCWKDKVAGILADQTTGSYQPSVALDGVGVRSVKFNGLHALDLPSLRIQSAVIVHKTPALAAGNAALMGSYSAGNQIFGIQGGTSKARLFWGALDAASTTAHATGGAIISGFNVGGGGLFSRNGEDDGAPGAPSAPSQAAWRIGADKRAANPASAIPLTGWIGEIVCFSAVPAAAKLRRLTSYLLKKWAIT